MAHASGVAEVSSEPFVVVGKIVDAVGHHTVAHHVSMVHAGAGFLMPCGVVIAFEARENVTRHVPHVSNTRCGLAALAN